MRRPQSALASSPLGPGRVPTTDSPRQTSLARLPPSITRRGTLSYAPDPHVAAALTDTAVRSPTITSDPLEDAALEEKKAPLDAGAAPVEKEAKPKDEDDGEDELPSADQLLAGGKNLQDAGNHDDDSDENDYHPPIPTFDKDLQDRSQDDIAHQLVETASIARRFRLAHSTMTKSLCDNVTAIAKSDKKDLHKHLVELSDQALGVYENNCLFSVETKAETADPLVRKLVWGNVVRVDALLKDAHTNISAVGGTIRPQEARDKAQTEDEQ